MDKTRPVSSATVVSVSFNTKKLTGLLLWSLDRILEPTDLSVLMVDNGSTDGTADLLRSAADAGLCDMILNRTNLGHGPALNLAIESAIPPSSEWVWVLDSDCVISRPDALTAPLGRQRDAAIIGEAKWDPWRRRSRLELYSLLVSRAALDLRTVSAFSDGGDPAWDMLESAERAGLSVTSFPFTADGYIVHLGRASLAAVVELDDQTNPLFEWALDHHEPHFGAVDGARDRHATITQQFEREVGPNLDLAAPLRR
jgi:glycosyltransferase involved in cell wall biosynthesis